MFVGLATALILPGCGMTTDGYHYYHYNPETEAALENQQSEENQEAWDRQYYQEQAAQKHDK
jgi:hypothetical protein